MPCGKTTKNEHSSIGFLFFLTLSLMLIQCIFGMIIPKFCCYNSHRINIYHVLDTFIRRMIFKPVDGFSDVVFNLG